MGFFGKLVLGIFLLAGPVSLSAVQTIIVVRHGEAENNIEKIYNSNPDNPNYKTANLTEAGKLAVENTAKDLTSKGFNKDNVVAVFVSPLPRTVQTAEVLAQNGLISDDKVVTDNRLIEQNAGDLEGKPSMPWDPSFTTKYHAESTEHVKERVQQFYDSISKDYPNATVVVVTHGLPAEDLINLVTNQKAALKPGEAKVIQNLSH